MDAACLSAVEFVTVDSLPGDMPVALVERDGLLLIYRSRQYDIDQIGDALTAAMTVEMQRSWVHMGDLAARAV